MPLTFAHPAAVLPLRRCGLPFSALVVGSLAPDLEYLIRLQPRSEISHTALGLIVFCLPAGLLGLWLFHRVWKRPMFALLDDAPDGGGAPPAATFTFWPGRRLVLLGAAILVGAMTHVAWDAFTHPHGWMVLRIPALSHHIFETSRGAVSLFKVLQHGSTVVGLAVLAYVGLRGRAWRGHVSVAGWRVLAAICGVSLAGGLGLAFLRAGWPAGFHAAERLAGLIVVDVSAVMVAAVTVASLLWHARGERSHSPPTDGKRATPATN